MSELPVEDAQALVRAMVGLASMADRVLTPRVAPLTERLRAHLGVGDDAPNTSTTFEVIERANLQLALDEHRASGVVWDEIGLPSDIGNYHGVSLPMLVAGDWQGPGTTAVQFASVEVSATETIRCLRAGVICTEFGGQPVALMVYTREHRGPELIVELAATTQEAADGFLRHVRERMTAHNVLRGKVVTFAFSEYGGFGMKFTAVPT